MKKVVLFLISIIALSMLVGCGNAIPKLYLEKDNQSQEIAIYEDYFQAKANRSEWSGDWLFVSDDVYKVELEVVKKEGTVNYLRTSMFLKYNTKYNRIVSFWYGDDPFKGCESGSEVTVFIYCGPEYDNKDKLKGYKHTYFASFVMP